MNEVLMIARKLTTINKERHFRTIILVSSLRFCNSISSQFLHNLTQNFNLIHCYLCTDVKIHIVQMYVAHLCKIEMLQVYDLKLQQTSASNEYLDLIFNK
jgi:hypothetical protein